ncbi:MAG: hypothetical protein EOO73_30205 [Myxococcales bacterium]|nr:MAG: hypothetical protein EOO73_30205 [Myxococcales bacterium]
MTTARSARSDAIEASEQERELGSGHHQVAPKRPTEHREQASVQRYLDRFAEAMTSGDMRTMTQLWGVPAFVIGRTEARVVQSESEVEQFFEGSKDAYNERGITRTRAEIQHLDWVGTDLVVATVRWPYLNEHDEELGEESSSYTLLRGEDGSYKLRSILMRGASGPSST